MSEKVNAVTPAKIVEYKTDRHGCACPARRFNIGQPCKHMLALLKAQALIDASEGISNANQDTTTNNGVEPGGGRSVVNAGAHGSIWDRIQA